MRVSSFAMVAALALAGVGLAFVFLSFGAERATAEGMSVEVIREMAATGDTTRALSALEELLDAGEESTEANLLHGKLLADLGRTREAKKAFNQLIEDHPDMPEPYNNLAVIHAGNGEYQRAIDTLRQALETNPSYRVAYENLSKLYGKLASEAYNRALGVEAAHSPSTELGLEMLQHRPSAALPEPVAVMAQTPEPPLEPQTPVEPMDTDEVAAVPAPPMEMESAVTEVAEEPMESVDAAVVAVVEPGDVPEPTGQMSLAVQDWADAWSSRNVDAYLGAYAAGFVPADGSARSDWEGVRRERLNGPSYIEVSVAFLDAQMTGADRGRIRFIQTYESDRFSDTVTKSLEMVSEDGEWKILEENVEEVEQ